MPGTDRLGPAGDESIAEIYASDVFVGEPAAAYRGHAGMSEAIANLQAQLPGAVISRSGPVQMAQDLVTYSWTLGVVFTHSLVHGWAPAPVVIVDIFRLENGRIVEHRDVVQDLTLPESTASGNHMV